MIKPLNKRRLTLAAVTVFVAAVVGGLLYQFDTCDEWLGGLPGGGMALNQTCECRGWNITLFDDIAEDGPRKFMCIGASSTSPGQPVDTDEQTGPAE